jgi:hypothetical protein
MARSTIEGQLKTELHPEGKLPMEPRLRPAPPWGEEDTVTDADWTLFLKGMRESLAEAGPGDPWKREGDIATALGVTGKGDLVKLRVLLKSLRESCEIESQCKLRSTGGRAKRREVYYYHYPQFVDYLAGRTVGKALADFEAIEYSAPMAAAARITEPVIEPIIDSGQPQHFTKRQLAMLLLSKDPSLSNRALAKQLGCSASLFNKDPHLAALRTEHGKRLTRGYKDAAGRIEAMDESDDPVDGDDLDDQFD